MELGTLVEFIDRQRIVCAVVMTAKDQKLRLLTENDREMKLSANRLSHVCQTVLDLTIGRSKLVESLKAISQRRSGLVKQIDLKELWEVLYTEQEWIDLDTMTHFCFPDNPTDDHQSAVFRAFFSNRFYFKFDHNRFFPYTEEHVQKIIAQAEEEAHLNKLIKDAGEWLLKMNSEEPSGDAGYSFSENENKFIEILQSIYLLEKGSPHFEVGKAILSKAGIDGGDKLFKILVKAGVWDENENVDLLKYEIPDEFSKPVISSINGMVKMSDANLLNENRVDLTHLNLITIDGQLTLDFDDAISIENSGNYYHLGVHIADVGYYVKREDAIDKEAMNRGSSIYMPDKKNFNDSTPVGRRNLQPETRRDTPCNQHIDDA